MVNTSAAIQATQEIREIQEIRVNASAAKGNRSAGPVVRTVLGDLDPAGLGVCDAHDHLFLRSPQLPGQELADPVRVGPVRPGAVGRPADGDLVCPVR